MITFKSHISDMIKSGSGSFIRYKNESENEIDILRCISGFFLQVASINNFNQDQCYLMFFINRQDNLVAQSVSILEIEYKICKLLTFFPITLYYNPIKESMF